MEQDELDSLLNGIDWNEPLSPRDLNLPMDPYIVTLLSSPSSPISPVVLLEQPPNPLVDKILESLTNIPIQFTDHPTTSRQESRVNILLPSLSDSTAHSNKTQSEELQSNPASPRQLPSNSTALGTSAQDDVASFRDLIDFNEISKFPNRKVKKVFSASQICSKPRYNPYLLYQLIEAFFSEEIVFLEKKRLEYTIQNPAFLSQRLVVSLTAIELQPVE